jgi:DNA-binding NarL/FixJ family response regulator
MAVEPELQMTDEEIELMLKVAAEIYANHKGILSKRNAKRQRSEAVWMARRNGWTLKQIGYILKRDISTVSGM